MCTVFPFSCRSPVADLKTLPTVTPFPVLNRCREKKKMQPSGYPISLRASNPHLRSAEWTANSETVTKKEPPIRPCRNVIPVCSGGVLVCRCPLGLVTTQSHVRGVQADTGCRAMKPSPERGKGVLPKRGTVQIQLVGGLHDDVGRGPGCQGGSFALSQWQPNNPTMRPQGLEAKTEGGPPQEKNETRCRPRMEIGPPAHSENVGVVRLTTGMMAMIIRVIVS
jgi:hypothetical protein